MSGRVKKDRPYQIGLRWNFFGPYLVVRVKIRWYTDFKLSSYTRSWILMVGNPNPNPNDD